MLLFTEAARHNVRMSALLFVLLFAVFFFRVAGRHCVFHCECTPVDPRGNLLGNVSVHVLAPRIVFQRDFNPPSAEGNHRNP
jgi:hypothetical protein